MAQQIADGDGEVTRRPMFRVAQKKSSNAQYRADKGAPNIKAAPGQDGLRPIIMAGGSLYVRSQLLWAEWPVGRYLWSGAALGLEGGFKVWLIHVPLLTKG